MRKAAKTKRIQELMKKGNQTAAEVVAANPDLAEGLDGLTEDAPRGSGATTNGPDFTGEVAPLELPTY